MADIPIAEDVIVAPVGAAPLALPIAEAYIPPISMFDLVPGRRYIISNRQVDAWRHPNPAMNIPHFDDYRPEQYTFIATFITLTKPKIYKEHHTFNPIDFLEGLDDQREISNGARQHTTINHTRNMLMMMRQSDVYPIFSYERGLEVNQLEDLTVALELECMRAQWGHRVARQPQQRPVTAFNRNLGQLQLPQHPEVVQSMQESTFGRTMGEALPGLLYFGHDEHSRFYKQYSRSFGENHLEETNFKYTLLRRWSTGWYSQRPEGIRNRQTGAYNGGLPQAARDAGYTTFAETYFNAPELLGHNMPNNMEIYKRRLLQHNLMIVLPRYWSFTYNQEYQGGPPLQNVAEVREARRRMRHGERVRRAVRRAWDGGKKTKRNKKRKKRRRKRTRR
tara:strand:+ start:78 stop:1253 length:1176 start_codon:yes stop_codon:yes gene_type:complete